MRLAGNVILSQLPSSIACVTVRKSVFAISLGATKRPKWLMLQVMRDSSVLELVQLKGLLEDNAKPEVSGEVVTGVVLDDADAKAGVVTIVVIDDVVAVTMLEVAGVVLVAVIVAAIGAEIGTAKVGTALVTVELKTVGIDPPTDVVGVGIVGEIVVARIGAGNGDGGTIVEYGAGEYTVGAKRLSCKVATDKDSFKGLYISLEVIGAPMV